jgi:hypothetical protein
VVNMTRPRWQDDEDLLGELKEAVRHPGRVPQSVREAGRAAFAYRIPGTGLLVARLTYDSLLDDSLLLRSGEEIPPRIVTFEADLLSVELELAEDKIVGQLIPPAPGTVTMITLDGDAGQALADRVGCFMLLRPSPRPVRFCCQTRVSLITDWMQL